VCKTAIIAPAVRTIFLRAIVAALVPAVVNLRAPIIAVVTAVIITIVIAMVSIAVLIMAITIMGGLFVATFLTLLYLPGLYALWFRKSLDESGEVEQPDLAAQHQAKDQTKDQTNKFTLLLSNIQDSLSKVKRTNPVVLNQINKILNK